ncbi:MAG TPA: hypothetical protein VJV78_36070 [Polyangiales bacterium]|nr:hypothetical protein [Polyangiales bacterium]
MGSLITAWTLALALGVRHASEPDHLVAVSTLVAGEPNARRAARLGAIWGIGHSLALLVVGGALLVLHGQLSVRMAAVFELGVAGMLLLLGFRSIARAVQIRRGESGHEHGHGHMYGGWRSLSVGLVHGLAGSGALTALALASMPSLGSGLVYMVCFGLGSVVGMAALSGLIGVPLSRACSRLQLRAAALATTGLLSVVVGLAWGWPLLSRV